MERIASKMEIKINKIQKQLWENCNGSENDNWKLDFISNLNDIKTRIYQNEINSVYILNDKEKSQWQIY